MDSVKTCVVSMRGILSCTDRGFGVGCGTFGWNVLLVDRRSMGNVLLLRNCVCLSRHTHLFNPRTKQLLGGGCNLCVQFICETVNTPNDYCELQIYLWMYTAIMYLFIVVCSGVGCAFQTAGIMT